LDGTLACEKPDYMEVALATERLCERYRDDESESSDPALVEAACDGDRDTVNANVEDVLLEAFEGQTPDEYAEAVEHFLGSDLHPRFERPYGQLYYQPMLELIDFLRAHEFSVYVVSGSQQGFVRAFGDEVLSLGAERAVGHPVELDWTSTDAGPELLRGDAFRDPSLDGAGKAEVIRQRLGARPLLAFGNSKGDYEMMRYATASEGPS
ncbi:MAG: HAD family hydrolase, partial [Acidobacteriota bacterium]